MRSLSYCLKLTLNRRSEMINVIRILLLSFLFNCSYFKFIPALGRPTEFKYRVCPELIVKNSWRFIPRFAVGFWSKTQAPSRARIISRSAAWNTFWIKHGFLYKSSASQNLIFIFIAKLQHLDASNK